MAKVSYTPEGEAAETLLYSMEAEEAVLGSIFLDKDAFDKIAEIVNEADFYHAKHQYVFRAIYQLNNAGNACDMVTVAEWLESHQLLEDAGGMAKLASLAEHTPTAVNVVAYATIVRNRSVLRQLRQSTVEINEAVLNPQGRATEELLNYAEQTIFAIGEQQDKRMKQYSSMKDLATETLKHIQQLYKQKSPITGLPTGYHDFDQKTAGLQPADLIIIAGRPSMGKTALAINIAENAAIKEQKSVAIFSMEMPSEQLVMRIVGSLSRIDQQRIRTGKLKDEDWPRLTSTSGLLEKAKIFIDDTPALTPSDLRARVRRIKREHGLDLVIIDYLQLMQVVGTSENRATEISEISRSLKAMAKELNVPVIALSQLNRSLEQRPNKRPVMSDLRESGAIEQDADLILFIYRDEVYNEDSEDKGKAEIIISKQRNGPIGMLKLTFLGKYTRFESLADKNQPPPGDYE